VVAVNDGTIKKIGHNRKLGQYIVLQDGYGNRFTYAQLEHVAKAYAVPKQHRLSASDFKLVTPKTNKNGKVVATSNDKAPTQPATRGKPAGAGSANGIHRARTAASAASSAAKGPVNSEDLRPRLYALPQRRHNVDRAGITGQLDQLLSKRFPGYSTFKSYFDGGQPFNRGSMELRPLREGSRVNAGTVLGRIGKTTNLAPHLNFAIQPVGKGAPKIDPKPILDGWKLLEATAIYRAAGQDPFTGSAGSSNITQDLLMPKSAVERKVLADPRLSLYRCGRNDVSTGQIDRRVLATMEYLADNGFRLTVTSLKCGSKHLSAGNASAHKAGNAMTIARINGLPVVGNQGPGTLAHELIKTVLKLQGVMQPAQVFSKEDLPGPISSAAPDGGAGVDIAFSPLSGAGYQNPFPDALGGRIDQGVDFVGTGPILAIGNARILATTAPGWPNGGAGPAGQGVLYRLLDGSRAGQVIYVYEGLKPTVHPGELVLAGQQIATFYPGSSIEIGFADAAGTPLSHAIYHEGMATPSGHRMASFLSSVGVARGAKLNRQFSQLLRPGQWTRVINRIGRIRNPRVPTSPSRFSLPAGTNAHRAHSHKRTGGGY